MEFSSVPYFLPSPTYHTDKSPIHTRVCVCVCVCSKVIELYKVLFYCPHPVDSDAICKECLEHSPLSILLVVRPCRSLSIRANIVAGLALVILIVIARCV